MFLHLTTMSRVQVAQNKSLEDFVLRIFTGKDCQVNLERQLLKINCYSPFHIVMAQCYSENQIQTAEPHIQGPLKSGLTLHRAQCVCLSILPNGPLKNKRKNLND